MLREYPIKRFDINKWVEKVDVVAEEAEFTLFVNGEEFASFLCTPADQINLGLGYLVSEGIIQKQTDVLLINFQEMEHYVDIRLEPSIKVINKNEVKKVLTSGCGKGSIFLKSLREINLLSSSPVLEIHSSFIYSLMQKFQKMSELFLQTGGVHSVGLCTPAEILFHKEDIGRHNAVDKILGECLSQNLVTSDKILLLSGRMATEIVQKAGRAGIQILLSKSAPTSMAIDMANKIGMTLVGFVRGERMNVYSHPKRIISS